MPSPDQLFRLDPLETKLTDTQRSVVAQGLPDTSARDTQLLSGLQSFSSAIGSAAEHSKRRRIKEDIILAENAALRNEVMPESLLPIAQDSYAKIIELNEANNKFLEYKTWTESEEVSNVVKNFSMQTADKMDFIDTYSENLVQKSLYTFQYPEIAQKYKTKIDELKQSVKKDILNVENDYKYVQSIEALSNQIDDAVSHVEKSNVYKGTDLKLTDVFTEQWINNNSKDLGNIFPNMPDAEKKLLIFKALTVNESIIADADVIQNLLSKQFNKGFTYANLYFGKGEDSLEFQKIYNKYLENQKAYFDNLENNQQAADKERISTAKLKVFDDYKQNPTDDFRSIAQELENAGMNAGQVNTVVDSLKKYNKIIIKEQKNSPVYNEIRDLILSGQVKDKATLQDYYILGNLSEDAQPSLNSYLDQEGKQRKDNVAAYLKSTATIRKNLVSLIKTNLTSKNAINDLILSGDNTEISDKVLIKLLAGSSLDPDEFRLALNDINQLVVDLETLAETNGFADAAAEGPGTVPPEKIKDFQSTVQTQVKLLADKVNGILTADTSETERKEDPLTAASGPLTFETFNTHSDHIRAYKENLEQRKEILETTKGNSPSFMNRLTTLFDKEETLQDVKDKLIVDVPLNKKEQAFLDQLKSGKNPAKEYKEAISKVQKEPTKAELLEQNPEAALRLKQGKGPKEKPIFSDTVEYLNKTASKTLKNVTKLFDAIWEKTSELKDEIKERVVSEPTVGSLYKTEYDKFKKIDSNLIPDIESKVSKLIKSDNIYKDLQLLEGHKFDAPFHFPKKDPNLTGPYGITASTAKKVLKKTLKKGDKLSLPQIKKVIDHLMKDFDEGLNILEAKSKTTFPPQLKRAIKLALYNIKGSSFNKKTGQFKGLPAASKALAKGDFPTALYELFSKEEGITVAEGKFNKGIYKRSVILMGLAESGL